MPDWQIGERLPDGRWLAPAAERNKGPILDVLRRVLPAGGMVLEIGSGTGQHVARFAQALPALVWQPSDVDEACRDSIARWLEADKLANVRPPIRLDVHERPWPIASADAVICINVLHVTPWSAAIALFDGAREVLAAGGTVFLYGPYMRGGRHTAESNAKFDASLRAHRPSWGVRDVDDIAALARDAGFADGDLVQMPADNLSLVFRKAA